MCEYCVLHTRGPFSVCWNPLAKATLMTISHCVVLYIDPNFPKMICFSTVYSSLEFKKLEHFMLPNYVRCRKSILSSIFHQVISRSKLQQKTTAYVVFKTIYDLSIAPFWLFRVQSQWPLDWVWCMLSNMSSGAPWGRQAYCVFLWKLYLRSCNCFSIYRNTVPVAHRGPGS